MAIMALQSPVFAYDKLIRDVRSAQPRTLGDVLNAFLLVTTVHQDKELELDALQELELKVASLVEEQEGFSQTPSYEFAIAMLGPAYEKQELFRAITQLDVAKPNECVRALSYAKRLAEIGWFAGAQAVEYYGEHAVRTGAVEREHLARVPTQGFAYDPCRRDDRLNPPMEEPRRAVTFTPVAEQAPLRYERA